MLLRSFFFFFDSLALVRSFLCQGAAGMMEVHNITLESRYRQTGEHSFFGHVPKNMNQSCSGVAAARPRSRCLTEAKLNFLDSGRAMLSQLEIMWREGELLGGGPER